MKLKATLIGAAAAALAMAAGTSLAANYGQKEFVVIGSWGNMDHWQQREGPFWMDRIPKVSGGTLTNRGNAVAELRRPTNGLDKAVFPELVHRARAGKVRLGAPNRPDLYPSLPPSVSPGAARRLLRGERGER